jgi:predicted RNA binding protein YcfA (HicA-like mRNA interferase family)
MKIPRDLSGHSLVNVLCRTWGYRVIHLEGSHIVLETEEPSHQRIVVPAHKAYALERSAPFCAPWRSTKASNARSCWSV